MSPRRARPAASQAIGSRALDWLKAWTGRHEYRRRRAIFRPADAAALDPRLAPFVEQAVVVRFVRAAEPRTAGGGQRFYRIVSRGAPRLLRPERDFDFLE
ncbi:MAG TPA: hypothetical protein VKE96_25840 [Vicinamibacterales bacterium]|nr:hypothetical protein [Vicinamibacterales bacterium]